MRITFLGHAGLFIEARQGKILCDPWFNPAYFGSWLPFPSNEEVPVAAISEPDYLYVSHLHRDHFDAAFLREHVSKKAVVLLPDYPLGALERELRKLGFDRFIQTRNFETLDLGGMRVTIPAMVSPTDGPIGDSGLIVDDGQSRIYDQNDSRPVDLERLAELGPFDAHFLQFSGAIWFPFAYQYPPAMLAALGRKKRANQMARALRYAHEIDARFIFPSAGPPCFLDPALFELNDFGEDSANIFPDQTVFLSHLTENGVDRGRLAIPGTVIDLAPGSCTLEHPSGVAEIAEIFSQKRAYLERYADRKRPQLAAIRDSLPRGQVAVLPALQEWFEPLLDRADVTCAGIGGVVVLDFGEEAIAIDFQRRRVCAWDGEDWDYHFTLDRALVEYCVIHHLEDWVNELFLSFRFQARRKGPFNEYVYNFFKCLTMERLQYAEGYYVERAPEQQFWESHGYRIQRRCPHLKADLSRFASIEDGVLTCSLHGWQFELATGRCLTSDDRRLYAEPLAAPAVPEKVAEPYLHPAGATVRAQCAHCLYDAPRGSRRASP